MSDRLLFEPGNHANVLDINLNMSGEPRTTAETAMHALPPVLNDIRQAAKPHMEELLQNLFNNIDDALFELADRSKTVSQQEMYFDSMRIIRLQRQTVASNFIRRFSDSFIEAFSQSKSAVSDRADQRSSTDFTLLDQDELEMDVAVSGIVSKVTGLNTVALTQLTERFEYLAKYSHITERDNPLGPFSLSSAFAKALTELEVDIKVRIILMKMFERFVMERMGPIYDLSNRLLADAGVLPKLGQKTSEVPTPQRTPAQPQTPVDSAAEQPTPTITTTGNGEISLSAIQNLLTGLRVSTQSPPMNASLGASLPAVELLKLLDQLQSISRNERIDIEAAPQPRDVRQMVLSQPNTKVQALGQIDDDTVNFVGMLFDYILSDRNLAIPMKALIGRLQIPIVKLAILDRKFFEKGGHPGRVLLNELSSAGIGWSTSQELTRDALYDKIESIVLRILNEFSDNADIFTELLQELREFVYADSRRSVLVEQRVKEAELGKTKTQEAKLKVQALLNEKACGLRLPIEVGRFLAETWTRIMTLRMVKYGDCSHQWENGVEVLERLLWALQPTTEYAALEKRSVMAAQLAEEIAVGMQEIGNTQEDIEAFQNWLEAHFIQLEANDRAYLTNKSRPKMKVQEDIIEEIILATPAPIFDESAFSPEIRDQLKRLREGSWVELQQDNGGKLRCKLANISDAAGNYVFVNRRGMKVLEKNRSELAHLFENEQLKPIDESQVFDRALQSVIGNLRQMQQAQ